MPDGREQLYADDLPHQAEDEDRVAIDDVLNKPTDQNINRTQTKHTKREKHNRTHKPPRETKGESVEGKQAASATGHEKERASERESERAS